MDFFPLILRRGMRFEAFILLLSFSWKVGPHAAATTTTSSTKEKKRLQRKQEAAPCSSRSSTLGNRWWHRERRKAKQAYTMAIFSSLAYEKFRTNQTDVTWELSVSQGATVGKSHGESFQNTRVVAKSGQRFRDKLSRIKSRADALLCRLDTSTARRKKCGNSPSTQVKEAYTIDYLLEDWQ